MGAARLVIGGPTSYSGGLAHRLDGPHRNWNDETARALASMDDRKWIAIMVSSMLLLVGAAAVLVSRPELLGAVR
ncbi:hypothetical protein BJS_09036 [Bradyrhizobium japonicum SEMIA 5079]|nr:hypothetical protein BJS_09096 [Bradyrhizobium japonicum SEMIA 5079]AHY52625.1 hypothetical protein BJS_09036 [Bradyrhizobium japonicum SEMIA 5079]